MKLEREMGTELVSWVRMRRKAGLHGCVILTRENLGIVALPRLYWSH